MEKPLLCLGQHQHFLKALDRMFSVYLTDVPPTSVGVGFHKTRMLSIRMTFPAGSEKVIFENIGKIARIVGSVGSFEYLLIRIGLDYRAYRFEDMAKIDPSILQPLIGARDRSLAKSQGNSPQR